jgi:hypothetical protein
LSRSDAVSRRRFSSSRESICETRTPIQVREISEFFEFRDEIQSRPKRFSGFLKPFKSSLDLIKPFLDSARFHLQSVNFGRVTPTKNITATIIQAKAIVFLVTLSLRLDLARTGNRLDFAPETILSRTTDDVAIAMRDLTFEPGVKGGIGFYCKFSSQGFRLEHIRVDSGNRAHTEIDQSSLQVGLVHPFGHAGVMFIRNQKGKAEIAQVTLDRAFPIEFFVAYLDQFSDIGHFVFFDAERGTKRRSDGYLPRLDIAPARLETLYFGDEFGMLPKFFRALDSHFVLLVFDIRNLLFGGVFHGLQTLALRNENIQIVSRLQSQLLGQFGVTIETAHAAFPFRLKSPDIIPNPINTIAAIFLDAPEQLTLAILLGAPQFLDTPDGDIAAGVFFVQLNQTFFQQVQFDPRKEGFQRLSAFAQAFAGQYQFAVPFAIGHQRMEHFHLRLALSTAREPRFKSSK